MIWLIGRDGWRGREGNSEENEETRGIEHKRQGSKKRIGRAASVETICLQVCRQEREELAHQSASKVNACGASIWTIEPCWLGKAKESIRGHDEDDYGTVVMRRERR